jgi:hypothetical protein
MAALGLMAFSATAALAVNLELGDKFYSGEAGKFLINTGTASPKGLTTQEVFGKQIGSGKLLIPGKSAEIVCEKGEVVNNAAVKSVIANEYENFLTAAMAVGGHGSGTMRFTECRTEEINSVTGELTGVKLTKCVPNFLATPGEITANFLLLVKKHEGLTYLLVVPKVTSHATAEANEKLTSAFTTIKFNEETCSLPPTVNVTGSLVTRAPALDGVLPRPAINSFSVAGKMEQALLGAKLKFGANEAFVEAKAEAELVGKVVPWGAM